MRAAILESPGTPLVVRDDVEIIEPRAGEVRVRVRYCGLCHSDFSIAAGAFPIAEPIILGHEASGTIDAVGPGVTHLAPGDPVILTPLPACGGCYFCVRGQPTLCVNGASLATMALPDGETGLSRGGRRILRGVGVAAFAEFVVTPATGAIKIDPDVPLDIACVIGCAMQTGVGAVLNTAAVEYGATVLVQGLGGVGLATVQGARIANASLIIGSDPVADRRGQALRFGATHAVDPLLEDLPSIVRELTGGLGVDYAFETAGKAALVESGVAMARAGGTIVAVGAPALEESVTLPWFTLFASTEKKLCGCLLGSCNAPRDIPRLVSLWRSGRLDLAGMVTHRRPLEDINLGFADMAAGRGIRTVLEI